MPNILPMLSIHAIPAFTDNYIWLLQRGRSALAVDPGDAVPLQRELQARDLVLEAILITHWHPDHIGGLSALLAGRQVPVYGPRAESARIPLMTQPLDDGDRLQALGFTWQVLSLPGHTLGHIAYLTNDILLCGDTLFSAGCGRLFEGTPQQMHASLSRLAALPPATRVYCTHEYTAANLAFARAVEPHNADVAMRSAEVAALRAKGLPSLPTTIGAELTFNPFLRCTEAQVVAAAQAQSSSRVESADAAFASLRAWKDRFRA